MLQTNCLIAVNGHETIHEFDRWNPIVREIVREASTNICCFCFHAFAQERGVHLWHCHDPYKVRSLIHAFETGDEYYVNRAANQRSQRERAYQELSRIPLAAYRPSTYLDDPLSRRPRDHRDAFEGSILDGPRLGTGLDLYPVGGANARAAVEMMEYLRQDLINTFFIKGLT